MRLYPTDAQRQLTMDAGEVLVLPAQGEGRIRSEPLRVEGNLEDHEALIVVAATESVDYGGLAPKAGATLTETMERALDGGRFPCGARDGGAEPGVCGCVGLSSAFVGSPTWSSLKFRTMCWAHVPPRGSARWSGVPLASACRLWHAREVKVPSWQMKITARWPMGSTDGLAQTRKLVMRRQQIQP